MMQEQADPGRVLGVLEVLNRSGNVVRRLPWDGATLRIGRAYDNDIILDDPYVCPHHLELVTESGQLLARDLGSVNGTYAGRSKERSDTVELSEKVTVWFGHSQLRYHPAGSEVGATWRDTARHGPLALLGSPWVMVLAVLLALSALIADDLLDSAEDIRFLSIASGLLYPLIAVLLWAGFWSLLNRVVTHRANFHVHLAISLLGVAGLFYASELVLLVCFAMAWDDAAYALNLIAEVGVALLAIYAHLRYAVHGAVRQQAVIASIVALVLFGTPEIGDLIDRREFSSLPYLDPLLRPPAFRIAEGESVEAFFEEAQSLREQVDEAAVD